MYLPNKVNPPKLPKLNNHLMAILNKRQETEASNPFPALPVEKGTWIGVTSLPYLQVVLHVDYPEDYWMGAVAGAIYGGVKEGEWNPLHLPESDLHGSVCLFGKRPTSCDLVHGLPDSQ